MKSLWTGAIGFGLVHISLKLFSAVESSNLDLDMLDKKDHANIRFKRVNENTGKKVPWANIVRAYNMNGNYVLLSEEDFQEAMPKKAKTIEINSFVDESDIAPIYFETSYYIEPEKRGKRAYALLRHALTNSKKAGLGRFVLRNKEPLCLIKADELVLVLHRLRFQEEIRTTSDQDLTHLTPKPAELKMALPLIDQLSEPFDIKKFKDTYS